MKFVFCAIITLLSAFSYASAGPPPLDITEVAAELSGITYKEPGMMKESGAMYGLSASYTKLSEPVWKIEARLSTGLLTYHGAACDMTTGACEPLTISGIKDNMFEVRGLLAAQPSDGPRSFQGLYFGLGYRYLYDGLNKGPGGYRRESNYYYLPVGFEGSFDTESEWTSGFVIEYDYFLHGRQISHQSDINPGFNDLNNTQDSGYGLRGSLKFSKPLASGQGSIVIEPFIRRWKIQKSDMLQITYNGVPTGYVGYEPANNSTEIGLRCSLRF